MKNRKRFLERMSEIDDELLLRADGVERGRKKSNSYKKWIILAAAILVTSTVVATATVLHVRNEDDMDNVDDVLQAPISDVCWVDTRERNDKNAMIENSAIVWPWNCRDVYSQYTEISVNGVTYRSRSSYYGGEVYANQIGKKLCDTEARGYDEIESLNNGKAIYHTIRCEVFEIANVDSERLVAVKYEGYDGYYAFMEDKDGYDFDPPATLGELIEALNLTENIKLNSFYCDEDQDHHDEHYALSDESSDALWKILLESSTAPALSSDYAYGNTYESTKISFAINSTTLGVYNLSFSFSDEGYLRTNIENYGYVYNIGTDAANKIIDFVLKNKLVLLVSEKQYIVGTVTEIGEDYIKVDDSVMMKNSEEGIEFTVYATNMNIRRYIISGYVKVGDTVRIEHGYLPKEGYTEVRNAVDLVECTITSSGQVLIPE